MREGGGRLRALHLFLYVHIQHFFHDGSHVIVFVFSQTTTEDDVGLLGGQGTILVGELVVAVIVDRIVGFHAGLVLGAVLLADDGLGTIIDGLTKHLEVLVLDDAGIGFVMRCVVDHGIALIVGSVFDAGFETDGTPVKLAELEIEILVYLASEHQFVILTVEG